MSFQIEGARRGAPVNGRRTRPEVVIAGGSINEHGIGGEDRKALGVRHSSRIGAELSHPGRANRHQPRNRLTSHGNGDVFTTRDTFEEPRQIEAARH